MCMGLHWRSGCRGGVAASHPPSAAAPYDSSCLRSLPPTCRVKKAEKERLKELEDMEKQERKEKKKKEKEKKCALGLAGWAAVP